LLVSLLSLSAADVSTNPVSIAPADSPTALPDTPAVSQPALIATPAESDVAKEAIIPEEVNIPTTNAPETTEPQENFVEAEKESHVLPIAPEVSHVQHHVRPANTFPVPLPAFAPVSAAELEDDQKPR